MRIAFLRRGKAFGRGGFLLPLVAFFALCGCGEPQFRLSLHPASAMERLGGPTGAKTPPENNSYALELARNETEPFQVQVRCVPFAAEPPLPPPSAPLAVEVTVERVRAAGEIEVAWEPEIRVYQILDVHCPGPDRPPSSPTPPRQAGWLAEVCYPTRRALPQEHRPEVVTFLFEIKAPPGRRPPRSLSFTYRLTFTVPSVMEAAPAPARLGLTVTVFPFQIPRHLPFKAVVGWSPTEVERYLGRALGEKECAAYLDFFRDFRLTPLVLQTESQGPAPARPHDALAAGALAEVRALGWGFFSRGADSLEYYRAAGWANNRQLHRLGYPAKASRWKLESAGTEALCYPFEDCPPESWLFARYPALRPGTAHWPPGKEAASRPIPSLRLINLRDALEDWAAFLQYGPQARLAAPADTRDPEDLASLRRAVYLKLAERGEKRE